MSKADSEKLKLIQDKCQVILGNLLREEDNKYCVDCDAKGPRWASWNLGIFLCIRCAGIHRNLGVHISKVKSVNLDTWTPEQVACLQQMGNSQARAVYEANLPENFRRPQTDSSLEAFIRAKYEQKKYIAKEWVQPPPPPPAFDIDEEKKKERERKKNKTKVTNVIEISPLPQHPTAVPRPHSAGPHSPAIQSESSKQTQQVPHSSDLLNLGGRDTNLGDIENSATDLFDAFVTSPTGPLSAGFEIPISKNSVANEETDFFNQKAVSDTNKSNKMTKESILSLYGSNSCTPVTQHIPPVYAVHDPKFWSENVQKNNSMNNAYENSYLFSKTFERLKNSHNSLKLNHYRPMIRMNRMNPYRCPNMKTGMYLNQQGFAQMGMPSYQSVPTQGINPSTTATNMPAVYPFASIGATAVRQEACNQPNMWIGGRDESLLMAHGMGQVTQQMASLQLSGQPWNVGVSVPPVNAPGMVISTNQTNPPTTWPPNSQNQNFSNNLWQ